MRRNILVAGGAGFIGSNLCEALIKSGHTVVCVDNFVTGDVRNLKNIIKSPSFTLIEDDITKPLLMGIKGQFDVIVNLACIASPKHYSTWPIETLLTSVIGTKNLLDLAEKHSAFMIQASTSEVYGDPDIGVLDENYHGNVNPIGPRGCYDEGKRAAETLCMDYGRQKGVNVQIIRIFNTYGPNMASCDGRAIPEFICKALKDEPIEIYGDGYQTRSFMYISDLLEALMSLIEIGKVSTTPINVGNPDEEVSVFTVAKYIKDLTGSNSPITHLPALQDDPRCRKPSIIKAMELLNWCPKVSLQDGLTNTISYFRNNYD